MPEKPPYFPFYPKDFVTDEKVMNMCTEAVGAYIRLLCAAWIANPPATIPNDDAALARLAGLSPLRWAELRAEVLPCWSPTKDGRLTQRRLAFEYHKADRKIRVARQNGKKGGRPPKNDGDETMMSDLENSAARRERQSRLVGGLETQGFSEANRSRGYPDQDQTRVDKKTPPPTTDDARAVEGYAREVVGLGMQKLVGKTAVEVLVDFGLAGVVELLEHLASRRPSERFKGARSIIAVCRSLLSQAEQGPLPREHEFEPFTAWRARANARVFAVGGPR